MITTLMLAATLLGGYDLNGTWTECEAAPETRLCVGHPDTPAYELASACNAQHGLGSVLLCSDCTPLCVEPVEIQQ